MDTLEALNTRRSVRKYASQEISESDMHILLETGMSGHRWTGFRTYKFEKW